MRWIELNLTNAKDRPAKLEDERGFPNPQAYQTFPRSGNLGIDFSNDLKGGNALLLASRSFLGFTQFAIYISQDLNIVA